MHIKTSIEISNIKMANFDKNKLQFNKYFCTTPLSYGCFLSLDQEADWLNLIFWKNFRWVDHLHFQKYEH